MRRQDNSLAETRYTDCHDDPMWHTEDSEWKAGHISSLLGANAIQPRRIVEIGCGAGQILAELSKRLRSVEFAVGYDIAPKAIELAKAQASPRVTFRVGVGFDTSERFDVVLAMDVLEHVENCFEFLRRLRALGSYKVLHIPLDLSVQVLLRPKRLQEVRAEVGHVHFFTKETAMDLLDDVGYRIIDWRYTSGATELPARTFRTRLAAIPRRILYAMSHDMAARLLGGCSLLILAT